MNCPYVKRGEIAGAEIGTVVIDDVYYIRVEATNRSAQFIHALDAFVIYIAPEMDSGRPWFQIPYTDELDRALIELVDLCSVLRESQPNFGQLELL